MATVGTGLYRMNNCWNDWRSLSNEGMECSETFWDLNYQFAAQILIYRYPYKNVTRKTSLIVT